MLYVQGIRRANDVEYGLCACVWSENSGTTHRVAQAMDVSYNLPIHFTSKN